MSDGKTYLITGASAGIGLELTKQLIARGDKVIAAVRTTNDELAGTGATVIENIDVTSDESAAALAAAVDDASIDVLINNAGVLKPDGIDSFENGYDDISFQLEINTVGPLRITNALRPKLKDGSIVAITSSALGSMAVSGSVGMSNAIGYRASKAGANMVAICLQEALVDRNILVWPFHPGYVKTRMTGHADGAIPVEESANGILARLDVVTFEDNQGEFWNAQAHSVLPW